MLCFDRGPYRFNYRVCGVIRHKGRVLLHQALGDPFWALPGGRAEFMETAAQTLRREMREELAVEATVGRVLWWVENFFTGAPTDAAHANRQMHELSTVFLLHPPDDWPGFQQEELHGEEEGGLRLVFRWFSVEALPVVVPAFLQQGLTALPDVPAHIVNDERGSSIPPISSG